METMTSSETSLINSSEPGIFGARVTRRIFPPLAALHAQDSATRVIYDVHQMMGAMGMTLEMSLHLWTYRMKALLSELGGRGGQASAVAAHCFP